MNKKLNKIVGSNVSEYRKLNNLSQKEVASMIGLKRGTITSIESGGQAIKLEHILKIADLFSINIDCLTKAKDWSKVCLCCLKTTDSLVTLKKFKEKPNICQQCNNKFFDKANGEGLSIDEMMKILRSLSHNLQRKAELE